MAEPRTGRRKARETPGNASSRIRRRPSSFLRSDAVRVVRAGLPGWGLLAAGTAAGALLILTEVSHIRYITTLTASCDDLAGPRLRDSCLIVGHESHHWGFAILGLLQYRRCALFPVC